MTAGELPAKAAAVLAAVRAAGSPARDLRDAAHEACHALMARVDRGAWDRETIHAALMAMDPRDGAVSEIMARAVEQLVCRDLGVPCESIDAWAPTAVLEAAKYGIEFHSVKAFAATVREAAASPEARELALAVLALPTRRRRGRPRKHPPGTRPIRSVRQIKVQPANAANLDRWKLAAAAAGMRLSPWLAAAADRAAEEQLATRAAPAE